MISQSMVLGMPRIAPPVMLTQPQSEELQRICRARSASGAEVLRARIILLAAKGSANDEIVHELSANKMTVSKWRRRFAQLGMAGSDALYRATQSRIDRSNATTPGTESMELSVYGQARRDF